MITVRLADYRCPADGAALLQVLDSYACSLEGGGQALGDYAREHLLAQLRECSHAFTLLAWDGELAVGLANCFTGLSTFAARPLVNVHDLAVIPAYQGRGVAGQLLAHVELEARRRGACKLTLEVLSGNLRAVRVYLREGFHAYALTPEMGSAQFFQKLLDDEGRAAALQA